MLYQNKFAVKVLTSFHSRAACLSSALILEENGIKIALNGVHHSGLRSTAWVVAPRAGQQANGSPSLIEDILPLPALLLLRSKSNLNQLYANRQLSAREIASLTGVSHSVVLAALDRRLVPTKNCGLWQPNTVRKILARVRKLESRYRPSVLAQSLKGGDNL